MKRLLIAIVAVILLGAGVTAFFAYNVRSKPQGAALPNPNGYDDFATAAQGLVAWGAGDLLARSPEEIRGVVEQNSIVLQAVREGLKKPSAVPLTNGLNWVSLHLAQLSAHKSIARLLVAEGMVHLQAGRTNEAARSFADCIKFAHAAHHRGLMIDNLVAIACQAIGAKQLVRVAPHVSPDMLRQIILDLLALDQSRESAAAIVQRDRESSRQTYGTLRMTWMRIVTHKNLRAVEMNFEKTHARSIASLRLVTTELAARTHERTRGKPPIALTDLVPSHLPGVPIDPFSQKPLIYRATSNAFLLYSVGPDGKDDGGTPLKRGTKETGDLLPDMP